MSLGFAKNGSTIVTTVVEEHEAIDYRLESEELGEIVARVRNNVKVGNDVYYKLSNP